MAELLREHNVETYEEVDEMFDEGADRVAVVQACGTGKSYIAIQWLIDNIVGVEGKRALVLEPLYGIISQFKNDLLKCCAEEGVMCENVDFLHYANLLKVPDDKFDALKFDYIILDEFHGVGAKRRGEQVEKLLRANPQAKVLGLTATPIRYLDDRRDMGAELFGSNVVRGVNLSDAITMQILPTPEYVMCTYSYGDIIKDLETQVERVRDKNKKAELKKQLTIAKSRAEKAEGLPDLFARKIKNASGKYIAFCTDIERLNSLRQEIENGLFEKVNKEVELFYVNSKEKPEINARMISDFEKSTSNKLKIMLAVDMLNEGMHVEGVDGCFMFRPTISPRIYLQQLGRVLSVRDDKNFSPLIFDVVNNINSVDVVQQAFQIDRDDMEAYDDEQIFIPFKIDGNDLELNILLREIKELVEYEIVSPQKWLGLAREYAQSHDGKLFVSSRYIDEDSGLRLGQWLSYQKTKANKNGHMDNVMGELLKIDPNFLLYSAEFVRQERQQTLLKYLKEYFDENGNLDISRKYMHPIKDENGNIKRNAKGEIETYNLGSKISTLKNAISKGKHDKELLQLIREIDPKFPYTKKVKRQETQDLLLKCLREYFNENGNLNVPGLYKHPITGKYGELEKNSKGEIKKYNLGFKVHALKVAILNGTVDKELLGTIKEIDPNFPYTQKEKSQADEELMLKCLKEYYATFGNLAVPVTDYTHITCDDSGNLIFYPLSARFQWVKYYVNAVQKGDGRVGKKKYSGRTFTDAFIAEVKSVDPHVFDKNYNQQIRVEENKNRMDLTPEEKLVLRFMREYAQEYGNAKVPNRYKHLVTDGKGNALKDENGDNIYFPLGQKLQTLRKGYYGHNECTCCKGMSEALLKIDPTIFDNRLERKVTPKRTSAGSVPKGSRTDSDTHKHHADFENAHERVHNYNPFDREL